MHNGRCSNPPNFCILQKANAKNIERDGPACTGAGDDDTMPSGMPDSAAPDGGDVSVRRLTHDDVEDALALSSMAGWNQRVDEWRLLIDLAAAGSFAASSGNRIVGTAIGIDYGGFSWIAMMLVES